MSSPSLAEARSRLPLRSLMERKGDGSPVAPGQGPWKKYKLYFLPTEVFGMMKEQLARQRENLVLTQVDLKPNCPRGPTAFRANPNSALAAVRRTVGGIDMDKFEDLGYTPVSDEALAQSRQGRSGQWSPGAEWNDPRKGPLYHLSRAAFG